MATTVMGIPSWTSHPKWAIVADSAGGACSSAAFHSMSPAVVKRDAATHTPINNVTTQAADQDIEEETEDDFETESDRIYFLC